MIGTTDRLAVGSSGATRSEIERIALCYLLDDVGDRAGIGRVEERGGRWLVPVVLMPDGQPLGSLIFSAQGELLNAESDSPAELADAADQVATCDAA